MTLFHFTFVAHLFPIFGWQCLDDDVAPTAEGIRPMRSDDDACMTYGRSVVWLTSRPSLKPTPADLDWLGSPLCPLPPELIPHYREHGPIGDRTAMVVVDLSPNSKRLRHYGRWLRDQGLDLVADRLSPSARTDWWVYFGAVGADRITGFKWTDAPPNDGECHLRDAIEAAHEVAA